LAASFIGLAATISSLVDRGRRGSRAIRWRGLPIGRIFLGVGAPHDRPQWSWTCHLPGRPQASDERGTGIDLDDCKRQFKAAWARIRAGLSEVEIAYARRVAEISAEALARYDRRHGS
jgi:hypothetical protein